MIAMTNSHVVLLPAEWERLVKLALVDDDPRVVRPYQSHQYGIAYGRHVVLVETLGM